LDHRVVLVEIHDERNVAVDRDNISMA
jgi:hypothetical protein